MSQYNHTTMSEFFRRFSQKTAEVLGNAWAFVVAAVIVIVWAFTGPLFNFSDTWQLVINTGTTIITFLMVFLIQNTQNRDGAAIQIKLDELILTSKAENEFIGIEKLTDKELEALRERCAVAAAKTNRLAEKAAKELHARRTGAKGKVTRATSSRLTAAKAETARRPAAKKRG